MRPATAFTATAVERQLVIALSSLESEHRERQVEKLQLECNQVLLSFSLTVSRSRSQSPTARNRDSAVKRNVTCATWGIF